MFDGINYIHSDIDGVLMPEDEQMSEAMGLTLSNLKAAKVGFGVNTARAYHRATEAVPFSYTTIPNSTNWGSEIYSPEGELVHWKAISREGAAAMAGIFQQFDLNSLLYFTHHNPYPQIYTEREEHRVRYTGRYGVYARDITDNKDSYLGKLSKQEITLAIVRFNSTGDEMKAAMCSLGSECQVDATHLPSYAITAQGVDKGYGLKIVADILGVQNPQTEILSLGDSPSDARMFEHSTGIVVGDAQLEGAKHRVQNPESLRLLLQSIADSRLR